MINHIVANFIKEARKLSKKEKKRILEIANKYYDNNDPDDPKHRWDHMLDVMETAKKIRKRDLDADEFGMIAFHDSGYKHPKGYAFSKKIHGPLGAKIFRKEGPGLGYTPEEVKRIAKVIGYHNHSPKSKYSPLLKDDLQMLMFSADEGTPMDLKDDAAMYFRKGRSGVYKGVDPESKDFIKQLVAKVRTFGNYSKKPQLKYYNELYPNYLQSKYDYWHSDDLEKDFEDMMEEELKEKKAEFDLPDLKTNPRNKITRLIKNLKWGVKVDGKPDSTDELLFTMDPKKKYEVIGDDDSDLASCVDLTNRVVKNMKDVGSLATLRSGSEIPHLTPMFKHKGKYYLRSGSHKYSDPYDSLDEIGDRWFTRSNKYPPPEYIDFYDLPAGETIDEKDLRKIINEVKKKSKKTYRKSYTDRPGYKKEKKASKLYTYVDPEADLSKGLLSVKLAPEDVLLRRYSAIVKDLEHKNKDAIIKHFEDPGYGPRRTDLIFALDAPIPDKAHGNLLRFRDKNKLVSWDPAQLKDLISIVRRRNNPRRLEEVPANFEPLKRVQWWREHWDKNKHFIYAPAYKVLTESGRIPPELLTIEDKDKYSIHGAILGCLGKNAKKFKYNITEDLPGDPWKAIINTDPVDAKVVREFHKYHNVDVDKAGVPYYFLTKNDRTGEKAVWFSDSDKPIPINNKKEREKAKKIGLSKGLKEEQLDFKF